MGPSDLDTVCDLWRLPRPRAYNATEGGYQNRTTYVSCAAGEFVVRLYTNVAESARQRFEHELLGRLQPAELTSRSRARFRATTATACGSWMAGLPRP